MSSNTTCFSLYFRKQFEQAFFSVPCLSIEVCGGGGGAAMIGEGDDVSGALATLSLGWSWAWVLDA